MKFMQRALCAAICCALSVGVIAAPESLPSGRTGITSDTAEQDFIVAVSPYVENIEQAMERSTNAHDLMLGAFTLRSHANGGAADAETRRNRFAERAIAHAGEDPAAWWRIHMYCSRPEASCDAAHALQRVRALDPTNVMVWSTVQRDDADSVVRFDDALVAAAAGDHWNTYVSDAVAHAIAFYDAHPMPEAVRLVYAPDVPTLASDRQFSVDIALIAVLAEFGAPSVSIGLIAQACHQFPSDDVRRAACHAVADTMAHRSDSFIAARPGTRLLLALADTPAEHAAALADCRNVAWLMYSHFKGKVDAASAVYDEIATTMYRDPANNELTVRRAVLAALGIPTAAPADWTTQMCDVPAPAAANS